MKGRSIKFIFFTLTISVLILISGCERKLNITQPAQYPTNSEIFLDTFGAGIDYQAFSNTKVDALGIDFDEKYDGTKSLKVTVPKAGDPSGWFAGGAFVNNIGRDLSGYNALTFWAKSSMVEKLGLAGLGNDNTGTSKYEASVTNFTLTTVWQKYIVPIPLPGKLGQEKGMFEFAAGADPTGAGYYIWFDNIQFEKLGTIAHPRPRISTTTANVLAGDSLMVTGTTVIFNVNGTDQTVNASPGYFTFKSSDTSVATVDDLGIIRAVGQGTATITASLGTTDATGSVTIISGAAPITKPPVPTFPASDVISLLSNPYTNVSVDTWSATWDMADVSDKVVDGDNVKLYKNLSYAGIEFTSNPIDAGAMNYFHIDIWSPSAVSASSVFKIKLVDFGANGAYGGGDDKEHELIFNSTSKPPLSTGSWISLDIPLSSFTGLTTREHLAQLIISGGGGFNTVWVNNIYFHK